MEFNWYAVYTRQRWEKKVSELLTKRDIHNYCPLNRVERQWSDRRKIIYEPLFISYVFVYASIRQHSEIRQVPGIINLVQWLNKPAIIKQQEIQAIKDFLEVYESVHLEKVAVNLNDTVRVLRGPLMDYEGSVVAVKSNTVKIILPSLGYMMSAEVKKANVAVVEGPKQPIFANTSNYILNGGYQI